MKTKVIFLESKDEKEAELKKDTVEINDVIEIIPVQEEEMIQTNQNEVEHEEEVKLNFIHRIAADNLEKSNVEDDNSFQTLNENEFKETFVNNFSNVTPQLTPAEKKTEMKLFAAPPQFVQEIKKPAETNPYQFPMHFERKAVPQKRQSLNTVVSEIKKPDLAYDPGDFLNENFDVIWGNSQNIFFKDYPSIQPQSIQTRKYYKIVKTLNKNGTNVDSKLVQKAEDMNKETVNSESMITRLFSLIFGKKKSDCPVSKFSQDYIVDWKQKYESKKKELEDYECSSVFRLFRKKSDKS